MLENLDTALSDTIAQITDLTPEVLEQILSSYATVYYTEAVVGVSIISFLILACITCLIWWIKLDKENTGNDYPPHSIKGAFIGFIVALLLCFASQYITALIAPEAYTIKQLTQQILL